MLKSKNNSEKTKKLAGTKLMNISAAIVAILGLASLINNILLFKNAVSQYVAQGYPSAEVLKYLLPSQLLPGLLEILAVYGGITMLLIAAGIINQNIAAAYASSSKVEATEQNEADENDGQETDPETITAEDDTEPADD